MLARRMMMASAGASSAAPANITPPEWDGALAVGVGQTITAGTWNAAAVAQGVTLSVVDVDGVAGAGTLVSSTYTPAVGDVGRTLYPRETSGALIADGAGQPIAYFADSFTDTDTVNLVDHDAYVGAQPWLAYAGNITIVSNTAVVQSATSEVYIDTVNSDGVIRCKIKCGAANGNFAPTIVFRGSDSTHYLLAYFSGDGTITLYERVGGAFNVKDSSTWTADTNWHDVEVSFIDRDIIIKLDTVTKISYTALNEIRGTRHGIRGFLLSGNKDAFDDFVFLADPPPAAWPGAFTTIIYSDAFTGSGAVDASWTSVLGTWARVSDTLQQSLTGGPVTGYLLTQDAATGDYAAEVKITTPVSYFVCGFSIRLQDVDHFIELEINNSPAYTGWAGFALWSYNAESVFRPVAHRTFAPDSGGAIYTLRVRVEGSDITAELVEAGLVMRGSSSLFVGEQNVGLFEARDATRINPPIYDDFALRT